MSGAHPPDSADDAADFARRWASRLDEYCAVRMEELGIPRDQIGASDHIHRVPWCAFNPFERDGGSNTPDGRINVDAGVLDDGLFEFPAWARARLRDRIDSVIAHEFEEVRLGSHDGAIQIGPETTLPISRPAREILRRMRDAILGR